MKLKTLVSTSFLISSTVFAARPFITDDARLTTEGGCQLESWVRAYRNSTELWALPACNPTGNFELTLGGGKTKDIKTADDYVLQIKTLFHSMETNGWGWGLAFGKIQHSGTTQEQNMLGNTYAYIPLSVSLNDNTATAHANLGWVKDKASGLNSLSWGIGGEFKLDSNLLSVIETYGDDRGLFYGQMGIKYSVIPNLFQIDTTLGKQLSGKESNPWISIGIRYTPNKLF